MSPGEMVFSSLRWKGFLLVVSSLGKKNILHFSRKLAVKIPNFLQNCHHIGWLSLTFLIFVTLKEAHTFWLKMQFLWKCNIFSLQVCVGAGYWYCYWIGLRSSGLALEHFHFPAEITTQHYAIKSMRRPVLVLLWKSHNDLLREQNYQNKLSH